MKKEIVNTSDGSSSIYLPEWEEHYHSSHGAIQEAYHVFIRMGLDRFPDNSAIDLLEMGLGTGLNCFITFLEAQQRGLQVNYEGIEAFPLTAELIVQLNHVAQLRARKWQAAYEKIHASAWNVSSAIAPNFNLIKRDMRFEEIDSPEAFDLVYYDAFGARVQPELWGKEIFERMYAALRAKGVLVTYSAKGSVRRALQEVGFHVERLPGPPGKREMLRAVKGS